MAKDEEPFGILDGKKVPLDESVWDLPEQDRVRIVVMDVLEDGTVEESRPFRFVGTKAAVLDEKTTIIG